MVVGWLTGMRGLYDKHKQKSKTYFCGICASNIGFVSTVLGVNISLCICFDKNVSMQ